MQFLFIYLEFLLLLSFMLEGELSKYISCFNLLNPTNGSTFDKMGINKYVSNESVMSYYEKQEQLLFYFFGVFCVHKCTHAYYQM